jgi:hypothetical protein
MTTFRADVGIGIRVDISVFSPIERLRVLTFPRRQNPVVLALIAKSRQPSPGAIHWVGVGSQTAAALLMANGISRSWICWHDDGDRENEAFMDLRIEIDAQT